MLSLSQPWMHVSCLHSHFGTRWSKRRNVSLMIMIKPQCLRVHWNSKIFHQIMTVTATAGDCHSTERWWCHKDRHRPHCLHVFLFFFNAECYMHTEATSATQQHSACCAHAFKLWGLGVHIKLIKSVVEIMVCCRPGTRVQWPGRLLISEAGRKWLDEGGRAPPDHINYNIYHLACAHTSENKQVQMLRKMLTCTAGEQSLVTASSHYDPNQVHNINIKMNPAALFLFRYHISAPHWGLSSCHTVSWPKWRKLKQMCSV